MTVTAADYVDALVEHMSEAPEDAEYPRAVFATFQEAITEAEAKAPGARAVLSLAAFYAPDAIPEELFQQPPDVLPAGSRRRGHRQEGARGGHGQARTTSRSSTSSPPGASSPSTGWPRPPPATPSASQAGTWAESALRAMHAAFPEPEPNTWPACERLVTHARAVAAHVTTDSRELAYVLIRAGTYLGERAALGDVVPLYERGKDVLQRLAGADPGNAGWQRDLSVSHNKIGDVLVAQGNLAQALESYRASLAIAERLAGADPGNAGWQRDLSVSHERIGDVLAAQGNLPQALESYRASLDIASGWPGPIRETPGGNAI